MEGGKGGGEGGERLTWLPGGHKTKKEEGRLLLAVWIYVGKAAALRESEIVCVQQRFARLHTFMSLSP